MAMQEELNNFERNQVWELVERPKTNVIGTKCVFQNKQDEHGVVTRNKARLVAQGFTQVEGLDFEEIFARVVLGILNANRKIRKRTNTDVAFTREYSRVSIFHKERECTN